jgi:uncharacterized membrane protein YhaH (DUF805 family)
MDWKYLLTSYDGRINRAKFWAGVLVIAAVMVVAMIIDNILGTTFDPLPYGFVYVIAALASLYSIFAIYAKRWHDRNKSGWWSLIILVPFIGGIWLLVECGILEGTRGANQYGPDPLGS